MGRAQRRAATFCCWTSALTLGLASTACIQPDEKSGGEFGTFIGNAVATDEDAGALPDNPSGTGGDGTGGEASGGAAGNTGAPTDTGGAGNGSASGDDSSGANTGVDPGGAAGEPTAGGDAGASSTGADSGGGSAPEPGISSCTFSVLTKPVGGRYNPRNIGAIWIADANGKFVKTLEVWAKTRLKYLTTYAEKTQRNTVDAITSATLSQHRSHTVSWDLKDVNGNLMPDGKYQVVIETTDQNAFGDSIALAFDKGAPAELSPGDRTHYVNMSIRLQ